MTVRVLTGDCLNILRTLPAASVNCVLTSPPYWLLRDYKIEPSVWGGDSSCVHDFAIERVEKEIRTGQGMADLGKRYRGGGHKAGRVSANRADRGFCVHCGAWRGTLGLEPHPDLYVDHIVEVFREARRVLRDDGVCWLNLGDSYAGSGRGGNPTQATSGLEGSQESQREAAVRRRRGSREVGSTLRAAAVTNEGRRSSLASSVGSQLPAGFHETARQPGALGRAWVAPPARLKAKDLIGLPWLVALALRDDGWYLRQWLPWVKRNGLPESVEDRPANSVETIFLLTKSGSPTWWRHADTREWRDQKPDPEYRYRCLKTGETTTEPPPNWEMRDADGKPLWSRVNLWSGKDYWYDDDAVRRSASPATHARVSQNIAAQAGSLRANGGAKINGTMKAVVRGGVGPKSAPNGSRGRGCESFHETTTEILQDRNFRNADLFFDSIEAPFGLISDEDGTPLAIDATTQPFKEAHFATFPPKLIEPLIKAGCPRGGAILDPFGGAGTTGLVADRLGRDAILIERNPDYADMARDRISGDAPRAPRTRMNRKLIDVLREIEKAHDSLDAPQLGIHGKRRRPK